jgi:hypothetical protein
VAHVPPALRDGPDAPPATDDLVEVELVRIPSGALVGTLVSVYRRSGAWAPCREAFLERDPAADAVLSVGVGPPRANWIECDAAAEADGWVRRPIPGAPSSRGPPVSVWVKFPGGAAARMPAG